jgi:hypothetical protein
MLPLAKDTKYSFEIMVDAASDTVLETELQISSKLGNFTPDMLVEKQRISLRAGKQLVKVNFLGSLKEDQYGFLLFRSNPLLSIQCSESRITGIVSVFNKTNPAVNNFGKQLPPAGSGFDSFEFWCPERRPKGENLAMNSSPALNCFPARNLVNGFTRPTTQPNGWVADWQESCSTLLLTWEKLQQIRSITLHFDTDFDHPMESSQMGHPEDVVPFCVRNFRILDEQRNLLFEKSDNHQTIFSWIPVTGLETRRLCLEFEKPSSQIPTALFEIYID